MILVAIGSFIWVTTVTNKKFPYAQDEGGVAAK
jgi:hypothetical protein